MGRFRRALGNEKVSIPYKGGCNIPSDVGGVERTLMNRHGGWRRQIARDRKARGIDIDPDGFSKV